MTRIAVLHPYFGPLPSFWPLTLRSMGMNPGIDWHLYTDQQIADAPANVVVHRTTFESMRDRIGDRVGGPIALPSPYKLCDFRPAFGHIFAEDLADYDYWGYGDLDVVWGDVLGHVGDAVNRGAERVLVHGHLSLLANTQRVNTLYREALPGVRTAREAFADPRSLSFDEFGGWHALADAHLDTFADRAYFDIYVDAYRLQANRSRRVRRDTVFVWEDGRCLELDPATGATVSEGAYIHLQKRPMRVDSLGRADASVYAFGPADLVPATDRADAVRIAVELERSLSSRVRWTRAYVRFRRARAWKRVDRELRTRFARR